MRSNKIVDKRSAKGITKVDKCSVFKSKKIRDHKLPIRDTISETISFVIKGELTPIKSTIFDNKFNIIERTNKKNITGEANTRNAKKAINIKKTLKKNCKQSSKLKPKVQAEASKKNCSLNYLKKQESVPKTLADVPKINTKSNTKLSKKSVKTKVALNLKKPKEKTESNKTKGIEKSKGKKSPVKKENTQGENRTQSKEISSSDELKKQQTINELLKQVNEEILEFKKPTKAKKDKSKSKQTGMIEKDLEGTQKKSSKANEDQNFPVKIKTEEISPDDISTEQPSEKSTGFHISAKIKVEPSDEDKCQLKTTQYSDVNNDSTNEVKEHVTETKKKLGKHQVVKPVEKTSESTGNKKTKHKKLKTKPKMTIIKKRIMSSKNRNDDDKKCKTKLFGFWEGPKRHRVASLNALAKVHCLYENESKGNILDIIDEESKLSYVPKKEVSKSNKVLKIKKESSDSEENTGTETVSSTRTLRSVPGLRGVGKHWDMHNATSSSDEYSDDDILSSKQKDASSDEQKPKKRCRRQTEIVMDLKDMVVKKRMASLNASAILAASYSLERRQSKTTKSDDTDSYDGSSDEYFAASDTEIKQEDDIKKEDDRKLIEVHTTPNKKVAVILNQDTDVTITGVYVNSTTRSTHHEGYCSIAGMQYRISATSHTQTAATAVATETLLQSSSTSSTQENSNNEAIPSSKSYTPLDALSNMQPPPGPGIQHNHGVGQQPMGPPQHVLPMGSHQLSPGLRHSCSSAFTSPHANSGYQVPGRHPTVVQSDPNYVHAGYYQPAGPLISATHGAGGVPLVGGGYTQQPQPSQLSKTTSLSEASPTSTTPSVASNHDVPPPTSISSGGDSSDSEVVITSVTTAKEPVPKVLPTHHSISHRYAQHQYPSSSPNYPPYTYHTPFNYHTGPPHNASFPPPPPHEMCFSSYGTHKYTPSYRRYFTNAQYYPPPGPQDIYSAAPPSQNQPSQQVVSAPPPASAVGGPGSYPSTVVGAPSLPPPPTILETYSTPQAALIETYPPPPPPHYYSPPTAYGPAASCYAHSPTRGLPYINPSYQGCPCPMQSCPKNGLTGPLTGDSKRSNMTIAKDSMPLPPVALALPLEPNSVMGPPSPARGSAGMPPPPSPAGATYQPHPPAKQESQSPSIPDDCVHEKKRRARVGKAMVRNNIAAGMQQNTMLLMCNPQNQTFVRTVKREIESPNEKDLVEEKKEVSADVKAVVQPENLPVQFPKTEVSSVDNVENVESQNTVIPEEVVEEKLEVVKREDTKSEEPLPPVVSTVAENVKVKNMKRKMSLTQRPNNQELVASAPKKRKLSSYKCLIKKDRSFIKINNGKRKLIEESSPLVEENQKRRLILRTKKLSARRKLNMLLGPNRQWKIEKSVDSFGNSNKKIKSESNDLGSTKNTEPKSIGKKQVNSKISPRSSVDALNHLFAKNSVDLTIESVVNETICRTSNSRDVQIPKIEDEDVETEKPSMLHKKNGNLNKTIQTKVKVETKQVDKGRKIKCGDGKGAPQPVPKICKRSMHVPKWSNGWRWEGKPYEAKVFINSDEITAVRKCYPAMMHETGDKIVIRDCVLLKASPKKNELPFVAKIASLWENPEDGEMMMSLLWYYRPEHTEQGRTPTDQPDEVFASRHKDSNSVACIDDKCYVLTFNEYCRYRKKFKRIEEGIEEKTLPCIPNPEPYPRSHRQPPTSQISPDLIFFCRRVYDFRQKRIMKNPT